ncbi:MAG: carbonic anhydrase [Candidatus Micrarchaeota archaeon]|nr:carbonic anhydrase [Candidatus Micrarchaeota archaeon]
METKIADEILQHNEEFLKKAPKDLLKKADELARKGQKPAYVLITCSDSRVDPEAIKKEFIGEEFEIRTAGHVLDKAGIESVQYAVEHLGVKHIVIMGHTKCGAVTEALNTDADLFILNKIREHIGNEKNLTEAIAKHSLETAWDLAKLPFIRKNNVNIHVFLYDIKTMKVQHLLSLNASPVEIMSKS